MNIRIKVKNITKLKDYLQYQDYNTKALTVEDFIKEMVEFNVKEYNKKRDETALFLISNEKIEALSKNGKIKFDVDNKRKVSIGIMQDEALFAFTNGYFKIINETKKIEYIELSDNLNFNENDGVVFIRLVLLSGRFF
jgi:hypothetical protein